MARVSIVTSIYNKAPWLERCLDSFINQTFRDIEFIIINNGSTDESKEIIEKFRNADSRVRVINLDENIGPAGASALGINAVSTEYFGICDADDYIDPNYVEVLYDKIYEEHADIAMCTNDMVWDNGDVKINKRPLQSEIVFTSKDIPILLPQLIDHYSNEYLGYYLAELGVQWGKIYRTDFVRKSGVNYDKDVWIYCDWLFNLQLIKRMGKMVYTEKTVYHFFQSEGSITRATSMNWNAKGQRMLAMYKIGIECNGMTGKKINQALSKFYLSNLRYLVSLYFAHYPETVTYLDIKKLFNELSLTEELECIYDNRDIFSKKEQMHIFNIKNKIVFPYILKKKITHF